MIAAAPGHIALFNQNGHYSHSKPVLAWDDQGTALILDEKRGMLRPARDYSNFDRVTEDDENTTVTAVPGDGWQFEYTDDNGETFRAPVVAWSIDATGWAIPLAADHDDGYGSPEAAGNFHRLVGPDEADQ